MRFLDNFSRPLLALDVGTAVTRACTTSSGIVERRSVVAEGSAGEPISRHALRGGVVCDIAAAAQVIEPILGSISSRWRKPAALICTPSDALLSEREALIEAVTDAGATVVAVVPEPLAAAIGSGIDVGADHAQMIVDIGEGVTDVAMIRGGAVLQSDAVRTGCSDLRRPLAEWLEWHHGLIANETAIDEVVRSFCQSEEHLFFEVLGRRVDRRLSRLLISRDDVHMLLEPTIDQLAQFVTDFFLGLPHAPAAEVIENGLFLSGGGSSLGLIVNRIASRTGLTTVLAPDPLHSVILGARQMLHSGVLSGSEALL